MKDNTFIGLLESQLELVKSSDGKDANSAILETAKLLISHIDMRDEIKSEYDKFDTRELFASLAAIGESATGFFDTNKDMLDPAALSGKLGTRLSETKNEIEETAKQLNTIKEQEAEFLSSESELSLVKKEYESLNDKVKELHTIHDTMTPAILDSMKDEIENLEKEIKQAAKQKEKLADKLTKLRTEYEPIAEELAEKKTEYTEYSEAIVSYITDHYFSLKLLFEKHNLDIDRIKEQIQEYQKLYARLEDTVKEPAELLAVYEAQIGENGVIVESMKKYGVKSLSDALDDIDRIKNEISENLNAYDLILKKVVEHEEGVRQIIERRQGKIM